MQAVRGPIVLCVALGSQEKRPAGNCFALVVWPVDNKSVIEPLVKPESAAATRAWIPGPRLRIVISVVLLLHITALWVGPFSVPPTSVLADGLWRFFAPYLQAAYLNHGYHFFAPEPGPSHLVRYELAMRDGVRREGTFPNLKENWPRLLYHRHFMLTEFLNSLPDEPRTLREGYARAYAQHLLKEHDARRVTLYLRRHYIPRPREVLEGMKLSNPALYEERLLGSFARTE